MLYSEICKHVTFIVLDLPGTSASSPIQKPIDSMQVWRTVNEHNLYNNFCS